MTDAPQILFVLYEGKHDAAILTRLLRENGFKNYTDKSLNSFPERLTKYFEGVIKGFTYEDELNLYQRPQLPNHVCTTEDKAFWLVFYEMGGDKQKESCHSFLQKIAIPESDFST
ncbi:MAG: hypothetical protein RIS47_1131 [Bacteroidota bacterium]